MILCSSTTKDSIEKIGILGVLSVPNEYLNLSDGAFILPVYSTHEYLIFWEYELPTPILSHCTSKSLSQISTSNWQLIYHCHQTNYNP